MTMYTTPKEIKRGIENGDSMIEAFEKADLDALKLLGEVVLVDKIENVLDSVEWIYIKLGL